MSKDTKNLEETIKEKVSPLLEEMMEKQWGISIPQIESDISDKLKHPTLKIYVPPNLEFNEAKKFFKKEFVKLINKYKKFIYLSLFAGLIFMFLGVPITKTGV